MNAAAGVAAAALPVEDWMRAAFPPQIANEPWELFLFLSQSLERQRIDASQLYLEKNRSDERTS